MNERTVTTGRCREPSLFARPLPHVVDGGHVNNRPFTFPPTTQKTQKQVHRGGQMALLIKDLLRRGRGRLQL